MNSISDNPVQGFEPNFFQIRDAAASNRAYSDSVSLTPGHQYIGFVYFDDAGSPSVSGTVVENARIRLSLPAFILGPTEMSAYVSSSNTNPREVYDGVTLSSDRANRTVTLSLVSGSAIIHTSGGANGSSLSTDELLNGGAAIGCDRLDGQLTGETRCAGYVTFRILVSSPEFFVTTQSSQNVTATANAKPGDTIYVDTLYRNASPSPARNILFSIRPGAGLALIPGSAEVSRNNGPLAIGPPASVDTPAQLTMTAGSLAVYGSGETASLAYSIRIRDDGEFSCGNRWLPLNADVTVNGVTVPSQLIVNVDATC